MKFSPRALFLAAAFPASFLFSFAIYAQSACAVSLTDALASRDTFSLGDPNVRSYDGTNFDAFKPFVNNVNPQLFQLGSFAGGTAGGAVASNLQFFMLSEVACYDGLEPGLGGNTFGVVSSAGNYVPVFSALDGPGAASSIVQGDSDSLTLALNSPEGLFSSIDQNNSDKAAHILAMVVDKAGTVTIDKASLRGASTTFNLQFGDVVLFIEDLLASGNILGNGFISDYDYNDMVVVVRSAPVPEPGTLLLLAPGLFAARRLRRKARA